MQTVGLKRDRDGGRGTGDEHSRVRRGCELAIQDKSL